jgi:hypothetical protein
VSYESDKQVFVRHYRRLGGQKDGAEAAWRVYYMARAVELGASAEDAEREYDARERRYAPNPRRRALGGGAPWEFVAERMLHLTRDHDVAAGVILENKHGARAIEAVLASEGELYRVPEASPLIDELVGKRRRKDIGFTELEAVVVVLADDAHRFAKRAEHHGLEHMPVAPEAAALSRWGSVGEALARRLGQARAGSLRPGPQK